MFGSIEMENCVHKKLTKSIGVCNFNLEQLTRLQQFATIKPAVIQVECHINLNQSELRDYCKRNEIILMGYTPFGDVHEATDGPYSEWRTSEQVTLDAPEMKAIAEKYKKTVYQVALRFLVSLQKKTLDRLSLKGKDMENSNWFSFLVKYSVLLDECFN